MQARGVKPDVVTYTALMALVTTTSPYRGRWTPAQRCVHAGLHDAGLRYSAFICLSLQGYRWTYAQRYIGRLAGNPDRR